MRVKSLLKSLHSNLCIILIRDIILQIMGGKKYSISPEEHIYAAVQLYVDVIMIFLSILNLGRGN